LPVIASPYELYQHTTTGKKLIHHALRLLGAIGQGEELEPAQIADGLEALNKMLDTWNTEDFWLYAVERRGFVLIVGTQDYTIGPSGSLDMPRPTFLVQGMCFLEDVSQSPSVEYELKVYDNAAEWGREMQKGSAAAQPYALYYASDFPLGTISLYPKPDAADNLVLYVPVQLAQLSSAVQNVLLPPGYAEAIGFNLALRLGPEYDRAPSAYVIAQALEGKSAIKMRNIQPSLMRCDEALLGPGVFDILTGRYR